MLKVSKRVSTGSKRNALKRTTESELQKSEEYAEKLKAWAKFESDFDKDWIAREYWLKRALKKT